MDGQAMVGEVQGRERAPARGELVAGPRLPITWPGELDKVLEGQHQGLSKEIQG